MLNKKIIISGGALAISLLMNIPRLLVVIFREDIAADFDFSYSDIILRTIIMFGFAWLVLAYNIKWVQYFGPRFSALRTIGVNTVLLFTSVIALTFFKRFISDYFLDARSFFFVTLFTHLIVLLILLLLAWLVNLTSRFQQNLVEKEQAKRKALYHQLEVLRSQVNPHFLFNTLNSLQYLIRQKSEKATVFVEKLSWLLRATLQQSEKDLITVKEELNYLEAYVFLQKERFGDKLNIDISIPEEWKNKSIPSFSLQLLVENAIKHNVLSDRQPLEIRIYTEDRFIVVGNTIQERRDTVESTGKGLSNLTTRYNILKEENIRIEKTEGLFLVKLPLV